ncbi:uncharacterized protein LOC129136803 [Pan troglodytes]|uniref:uncharacterized protein LOC129136803 n=1 Tax=Pan troglodytes TaxID=9598 RepID=UPI003013FCDF
MGIVAKNEYVSQPSRNPKSWLRGHSPRHLGLRLPNRFLRTLTRNQRSHFSSAIYLSLYNLGKSLRLHCQFFTHCFASKESGNKRERPARERGPEIHEGLGLCVYSSSSACSNPDDRAGPAGERAEAGSVRCCPATQPARLRSCVCGRGAGAAVGFLRARADGRRLWAPQPCSRAGGADQRVSVAGCSGQASAASLSTGSTGEGRAAAARIPSSGRVLRA